MATANERLQAAGISHGVDLQHYANGVVLRIIKLLNSTDTDLLAQITAAMERMPASGFSAERLDALLISVRRLNKDAYLTIERELTPELLKLVEYEAVYQLELFKSAVPSIVQTQLAIGAVNVEQVYTASLSRPFQGRLLKEWMAGLEEGRALRVRDAIRMGYMENQTISQIVQRLRGTRAKGYSDGIIEIDRKNAEMVTRTAISHMAGTTRNRFYEANRDLTKGLKWSAFLDTRTTEICILRDGKLYDNDHKPLGHSLPWLGGPGLAHWGCRSSSVPVLKSMKELGIDLPESDIARTRASMDGQVPADTSYGAWLKAQSAERQNEVLGKTRAKLLRDGGLTVDRFANNKGQWLTLDELRTRDAAAFTKAGL